MTLPTRSCSLFSRSVHRIDHLARRGLVGRRPGEGGFEGGQPAGELRADELGDRSIEQLVPRAADARR
jgi:hypothetical protein